MKPKDVIATHDTETNLTTWSRATKGAPIHVSFHPSEDPNVRAQQEADLARHLEERTPKDT